MTQHVKYVRADEVERLRARVVEMEVTIKRLANERDIAIAMLAQWCVDVAEKGTGWDYWDENYKDAMYRPGLLRELLDAAIADARRQPQ